METVGTIYAHKWTVMKHRSHMTKSHKINKHALHTEYNYDFTDHNIKSIFLQNMTPIF